MADRVVFLRPDAERIARVVRAIENGNRDETPLTFAKVFEQQKPKNIRLGTFEGEWVRNSVSTVTLKDSTSSVKVANLTLDLFPFAQTHECVIARMPGTSVASTGTGTAQWMLIEAEQRPIRIGTFEGSWFIDQEKTVTILNQAVTPNTVLAINRLCTVFMDDEDPPMRTMIAQSGGVWTYVNHECVETAGGDTCTLTIGGFDLSELPGYNSAVIQLLGHDTSEVEQYGEGYEDDACPGSSLRWYSITTCATATSSP